MNNDPTNHSAETPPAAPAMSDEHARLIAASVLINFMSEKATGENLERRLELYRAAVLVCPDPKQKGILAEISKLYAELSRLLREIDEVAIQHAKNCAVNPAVNVITFPSV